jgi:ATP-binding cassette subfamily B protein
MCGSSDARSPGALTIADLTFQAGSFRRLRNLLEGLLASLSSTAAEAPYLDDLFDFFRVGCAPISMYPKHYPLVARGV